MMETAGPIAMVVPCPQGEAATSARLAARYFAKHLGRLVEVVYRTGAVTGHTAIVNAAPDGYTVCAVYHSIMSFNPFTFDKLKLLGRKLLQASFL